LTKLVYELTSVGAFSRDYGLRDQIQRAAVSVMSNIAEGYVALDCHYLSERQFGETHELADKVIRQVANLITYLQSQSGDRHIREEQVDYTLES
jgi:hypothetical protein